jgi:hypothetical protein
MAGDRGKLGIGGLVAVLALAMADLAWGQASIIARVTPEAAGLRADYALPELVDHFVFQEKVNDVRADTWHVPDDMVLANGELRRKDGRPFQAFTVQITPDSAPRDRRYPALTRIGDGWQVYGPYFKAAEGAAAVRATIVAPKGWVITPSARVLNRKTGDDALPLDGWAFAGPADYVTKGQPTLVVAPNVEPTLRADIVGAARSATQLYTRRLGVSLPVAPTLIVTRVPQFSMGWQGDTTDGPAASLRFFGAGRSEGSEGVTVAAFVDHEFFHFWNSRLFHSRDGDGEAWLHEGMAEYAALLASREQGARDEVQVGRELASHLTGCAVEMREKGLGVAPPRRGSGVYDCGVLAQWSADLKIRKASNGRKDVFDLWRGLFEEADAHAGANDGAGFLKAAGLSQEADDPLRLLVEPGGAERWPALVAALNGLGARVIQTRSPDAERQQTLYHLMDQVCQGRKGYYGGDPKRVKLDTESRCGVLNGDPIIDSVAGHGVVTDALAARDAVAAICTTGGEVPLGLDGKIVATVACKTPMPQRPLAWAVEAWR